MEIIKIMINYLNLIKINSYSTINNDNGKTWSNVMLAYWKLMELIALQNKNMDIDI